MRRILLSVGMLVFVGAVVAGATGAFFTDEESSFGNTLAAGAIDLGIDNTSYYNGEASTSTTWGLSFDLDDGQGPSTGGSYRFFDFFDLKPGDYGEDTISFHVTDNDAWLCADILFDVNDDVDCTEPENDADAENGACNEPNVDLNDGDLAQEINFLFWADDGDNVLEDDEQLVGGGPINGLTFGETTTFALADSDENNLGGTPGEPIDGAQTHYLGKAWCFGGISASPLAQDGVASTTPAADNDGNQTAGEPADGGFLCDGAQSISNASQTDRVEGDITFRAVQSRNNGDFQCEVPDGGQGGDPVGALLSGYSAPEVCTLVEDTDSIQAAVDAAEEGDVICVSSSYDGTGDTFPITVDVTNLTIAGLGSAGDANIPGGFFIDASGVTIRGLEFTDYSFIASSENAAIYIHNENGQGSGTPLTGTTIEYNLFTAPGGAKGDEAKGVITEIGSGATPVATTIDIMHNVFDGWRQGMFFNTASGYTVAFNDIYNNDVGVANDGPHNADINHNDFDGNVLEAVGAAPSADNGTGNNGLLVVNQNNFTPAGAGNNVNWYGSSVLGGADIDATNNWWDSEVEADRTNDTAEVDTSSPAGVAFPEN